MANNKNTNKGRKTTKTNRSSNRGASQRNAYNYSEDRIRIYEIVSVALAVIFFCLAVIRVAGVWRVLHDVYVGIFGMFAACVFPLMAAIVTIIGSAKGEPQSKHVANPVCIATCIQLG